MSESGSKRILIVEDEAIVATDLEVTLKELGYEVVGTCADGASAVSTALGSEVDLVLMDIRLRGPMDGIEAAREISQHAEIPVVFLTAYADAETVRRAALSCTYGYLVKPFDGSELAPAIEIALLRRGMDRATRHVLRRLEDAFSLREEGILVLTPDNRIDYLSDAAARQADVSRSQAMGRELEALFEVEVADAPDTGGVSETAGVLRPHAEGLAPLRFESIRLNDGYLVRTRHLAADDRAELAHLGRGIARGFEAASSRVVQELSPLLDELRTAAHVLGLPEGVGQERFTLQRRITRSLDSMAAILRRVEMGNEPDDEGLASTDLVEPVQLALAECAGLAATRRIELRSELPPELPRVRFDSRMLGEALAALVEDAVDRTPRGGAVRVVAERHTSGETACVRVVIERQEDELSRSASPSPGLSLVSARSSGGFGFDFARRLIERFGGSLESRRMPENTEKIVVGLLASEPEHA